MQETVNTITMSGETMEVFIGAGCLSDCRPGTAVRLPGIISDLCQTLSRRSVSRTFINHIRIGDAGDGPYRSCVPVHRPGGSLRL